MSSPLRNVPKAATKTTSVRRRPAGTDAALLLATPRRGTERAAGAGGQASVTKRRDQTMLDAKTLRFLTDVAVSEKNGAMALALCRLSEAWMHDVDADRVMKHRRMAHQQLAIKLAGLVAKRAAYAPEGPPQGGRYVYQYAAQQGRALALVTRLLDATAKAGGAQ